MNEKVPKDISTALVVDKKKRGGTERPVKVDTDCILYLLGCKLLTSFGYAINMLINLWIHRTVLERAGFGFSVYGITVYGIHFSVYGG
jgi:hypothetical protein